MRCAGLGGADGGGEGAGGEEYTVLLTDDGGRGEAGGGYFVEGAEACDDNDGEGCPPLPCDGGVDASDGRSGVAEGGGGGAR